MGWFNHQLENVEVVVVSQFWQNTQLRFSSTFCQLGWVSWFSWNSVSAWCSKKNCYPVTHLPEKKRAGITHQPPEKYSSKGSSLLKGMRTMGQVTKLQLFQRIFYWSLSFSTISRNRLGVKARPFTRPKKHGENVRHAGEASDVTLCQDSTFSFTSNLVPCYEIAVFGNEGRLMIWCQVW